jgi:oligopeptide/dipeptide ABC transporter ATP-binding protein
MSVLLQVANLQRRFLLRRRPESFLHAVDGVSFRIARGEALGLVGESGCGKSTLARLVARLLDPDAGGIFLDGADLAKIAAREFVHHPDRGAIQMVFQDAGESLDPRYSARRAILEPIIGLTTARGEAAAARARTVADLVGLPVELFDRYPHQLSGGQKARVGIARALGAGPRLLILDEPTAALDVSVQARILRLFDDLRRRLELSLLFISHDLSVVRLLCARVMVMYLGQIVETGPSDTVFAAPLHPYTGALVDAIPDPARSGRSAPLEGEVPSAIDPPENACRFAGRCKLAIERCRIEAPWLREVYPDRHVACHLAG